MFKCKKCSSTNYELKEKGTATGLYCAKCGFWHKWLNKTELKQYRVVVAKNATTEKELSTAEKLLWLVEKRFYPLIYPTSNGKFVPVLISKGERLNSNIEYDTLSEAINAAYDFAKEGK